jgi:hypothetical protein
MTVVTTNTPTFDWSNVAGATGYTLQIATDAAFTQSLIEVDVAASTHTPAAPLADDLYYWRVKATAGADESLWSAVWKVTVDAIEDVEFLVYLPMIVDVAVQNGDFEQGSGVGWTEDSTHDFQLVLDEFDGNLLTPHSGNWAVWLGGYPDETSIISQWVPVTSGRPFLTFYHIMASTEDTCGGDFASVSVNGAVVEALNLCEATETAGWVKETLNLSAYTGQAVLLQFAADLNGTLNSNWFIDDVAFAASAAAAGEAAPSGLPTRVDAPRGE